MNTEHSTDMISRHAPDGKYLWVSPSCKQLTDNKKSNISIKLYKDDDNILVEVKDNGSGFDKNFQQQKKKSVGYTIINTLAKQLNSELRIKNEDGTSVSFSFVKKQIKGSSSALLD